MILFKAVLILCFLKIFLCDVFNTPQIVKTHHAMPNNSPNAHIAIKLNSTIENKKTPGFRLRLPFMDMELQNQRNVHIMQERLENQEIYVIHGNELFQMFISRDEKRLAFIGHLGGSIRDNEPLGAQIIDLRDYLIMVIAMEEHLEVYQLSEQFLDARANATNDPKRRNENPPIFEPIQQISLSGRYRQHFLTDPSKEHVMLIVGINFTKLYGRLQTFIWSNSYFEPVEELTVSPIHALYIMGTYPKYLVRGHAIKHQNKTIITVAEIQSKSMTLQNTQTLTVNSHTVHAGSIRGKNYLIACSNKQKHCNSFRMTADSSQFSVYKHRSSKDLIFDKFAGGQHFLVGARQNQILIYTSGRLDCYASYKTNESDVTSILTLVNAQGEDFILLSYKRPFHTLLRVVELEAENGGVLRAAALNGSDVEDTSALTQHRHMFESTIGALRSLLLRRRNAMLSFRKALMTTSNSAKPVELTSSHPVRIHSGEIGTVTLVGQNLRSPLQLLQRVSELRQYFKSGRFRRDASEHGNTTSLRVKNLKVGNLIYEDSVLPGFYLDKTAKPYPILSVRSKITSNKLSTQNLLTRHKLRHARDDEGLGNVTAIPKKLELLNAVSINGVAWQDFYDTLFLKNRDTTIKGRLILQAATNITNLTTVTLNGLVVKNLFNLREPQVVQSNLLFSGFLIKNLTAESVNNLDFANDLVFQNIDSFIETPVNMYQLSIAKDLLFSDNVTIQRTQNDEGKEFKQHYMGKVIINGTLTVNNLLTEQAGRTKIVIDKKPFSYEKIKQQYFLHNEPQHFNSTVIFGNTKLTVPSLKTRFLNDNPTEQHLLVNQVATSQVQNAPLFLVFLNAHIDGDLIMAKEITRIANLSKNAVLRNQVANITGKKIFEAHLTIDDVMTLKLNEMPVSELVLKSQLKRGLRFGNTKSFNSLNVEEVLVVNRALNMSNLNKLPLKQFLSTDYYFERLQMTRTLEATNVVFHKINGISFDEVFDNFKLRNGELFLHKKLIIEGNLKFNKNLNVTNINGLNWQDYQSDLVQVNENAQITGRKCFQEDLIITKALETNTVNDVKLEEVIDRVLSKSKPQVIKGYYAFGNVEFSNLDAVAINDVPATEFIDTRAGNVTLYGSIVVPKMTVLDNIISSNDLSMQQELEVLTNKLKQLPSQKWSNIVVTGNAFWHESDMVDKSQQELLSYIYKNAVQRTGGQQVISGNVKLIRPLITKMTTKTNFPKNFDLDFIAKDSVLRNTENMQIITATKEFLLHSQLHDVIVSDLLNTHLINGIDVLRFNASLYRLSSKMPIIGPLNFLSPLRINNFFVEQFINGINPALIYHNISTSLPPIKINKLVIDNWLQINEINGESLDYLLENRLTKNDSLPQEITGYLNFQNLLLNKNNLLLTLNGIPVDNLVFKKSKQLQSITGRKTLAQDLQLKGPVHVIKLNDHDISKSFQQTVFKNFDYEFDELKAQSATFEKGLILIKNAKINNEPLLGTELALKSAKEMSTSLATIVGVEKQQSYKPKNLLYLDYAESWKISCSKPTNISIHKSYQLNSKRTSLCERQFQNVQISYAFNNTSLGQSQIFLSNFTSNFVIATKHNISVKAENYCQHEYRKVKSKITITTPQLKRVIGLKKYIQNIFIYKPINQSDVFLLLHEIEFAQNRHELRVLRLHENVTDWQSLTIGIGHKVRLFDFGDYTALISGGGLIKNRPSLTIYHFNATKAQFELFQSITGDFDVFELLPTEAFVEFQLILSCSKCRQVFVYSYKHQLIDSEYEILQLIKLKTLVDVIQPFRLSDGSLYMLLLGEHDHHYYYLYRLTQLQGWRHTTNGYFENTEMVIPLNNGELDINEHNLLALLCGSNKCKLLKAVIV